jgi:hypothetical protein
MYHPFVNTKNLSDEELLNRLTKAKQNQAHAGQYGQDQRANELQIYIDALIAEYDDRMRIRSNEKDEKKLQRHPELRGQHGLDPITLGELADDDD